MICLRTNSQFNFMSIPKPINKFDIVLGTWEDDPVSRSTRCSLWL